MAAAVVVRHDSVALKITVSEKWMSKPIREALILPFVRKFNTKRPAIDPYSLRCVTVDGLLVRSLEPCGPVLNSHRELVLVLPNQFVWRGPWNSPPLALPPPPSLRRPRKSDGSVRHRSSQELHRLLNDSSASPDILREEADRWLKACADDSDALASIDERGRTPLHLAATRGDAILCAQLAEEAGILVTALDDEGNTPVSLAALCGRSLVLEALLERGGSAVVREKNKHLMTPLQLACCEDGVGSPAVAILLVSAGADVDGSCWDKTPLMAAAASDNVELVQTLVEDLGADVFIRNGESMMAADYCRTQDLADIFATYMEGNALGDEFSRRRRPGLGSIPPEPHQTNNFPVRRRQPSLNVAFADLGLHDPDLPEKFAKDGTTGLSLARSQWRKLVLQYHPDKQPPDFASRPSDEQDEWTSKFHGVQRAYEAIETHSARITCGGDVILK